MNIIAHFDELLQGRGNNPYHVIASIIPSNGGAKPQNPILL